MCNYILGNKKRIRALSYPFSFSAEANAFFLKLVMVSLYKYFAIMLILLLSKGLVM